MQIVNSDLQSKMNRMTILVGMVGSDGILLAADQRMTSPARNIKDLDDHLGIRKIKDYPNHKVAYAPVGDSWTLFVSAAVLKAIGAGDFDFDDIESSLGEIGNTAIRSEMLNAENGHFDDTILRSLLFVFYGLPEVELWSLSILRRCRAERIRTIAVRGALGNRARYFDSYFEPNLPIDKLAFLASHIVLTANLFEPSFIEGLDVAFFGHSGLRWLPETAKSDIRKRSKALNLAIRRGLFRPVIPPNQT